MIYQNYIDKKRKFCVIPIDKLNAIAFSLLVNSLQLIG